MKQLEKSAEKAVEREEKLKDKILQIQQKYKAAEGRYVAIFFNPVIVETLHHVSTILSFYFLLLISNLENP